MKGNILYLIGNGFDVSLGAKTRYTDFYPYYLNIFSSSKNIQKLKQVIKSDYETWADMETALGQLTIFDRVPDYIECIRDIRSNLGLYLDLESLHVTTSRFGISEKVDLRTPEKYLPSASQIDIEPFFELFNTFEVRAISFNYTDLFEEWARYGKESSTLSSIIHVHGKLRGEMAMGVDNIEQIAIQSFRTDNSLLDEIVKPYFNDACMNTNNKICTEEINTANIIVLFGLSLGRTDAKWWKLIGERVNSCDDVRVIYLPYDAGKNLLETPNMRKQWCDLYKKKFCEITGINEVNQDKVFVNLNTKLD